MGDQDNYCLLKLQNLMRFGVDGFIKDTKVGMYEGGQLNIQASAVNLGLMFPKQLPDSIIIDEQ